MSEPWEPETGNESWSDRDAWRGESHDGDDESWRPETDAGLLWADEEEETAESNDPETEDWPENLAGPEYWLYKRYGM